MDAVAKEGRTVLFVSHNMGAIKKLCKSGILMNEGKIIINDSINKCIEKYSSIPTISLLKEKKHIKFENAVSIENLKILINDKEALNNSSVLLGESIFIIFSLYMLKNINNLIIAFYVLDKNSDLIAHITNEDDACLFGSLKKGQKVNLTIETEKIYFTPGIYTLNLWVGIGYDEPLYEITNLFVFFVEQSNITKRTREIPRHSKIYLHTYWSQSTND